MRKIILLVGIVAACWFAFAVTTSANLPCIGANCYDSGSSGTVVVVNRTLDLSVSPYYVYNDDGSAEGPFTTCPLAIAAAIEPLISRENQDTTLNVRISGECNVVNADLLSARWDNDLDTAGIQETGNTLIPYKYIIGFIPTYAYVDGQPISDSLNENAHYSGLVQWDGVKINYDCTGQTETTVMMKLGDGFMGGSHATRGGIFYQGPTQYGNIRFNETADCDAGVAWKGMNAALDQSGDHLFIDRTNTVSVFVDNYSHGHLENLRISSKRLDADHTAVGMMVRQNNATSTPAFISRGGGLGFLGVSFHVGNLSNVDVSYNDQGAAFGDLQNPSVTPYFSYCTARSYGADNAANCGSDTNTFYGAHLDHWMSEVNVSGTGIVLNDGVIHVTNSHFEDVGAGAQDAFMVVPQICVGGTYDTKQVTDDATCTTGGGVALVSSTYRGATGCPLNRGGHRIWFDNVLMSGDKGDDDLPNGIGLSRCANGEIYFDNSTLTGSRVGGVDYWFTFDSDYLVQSMNVFSLSNIAFVSDVIRPTGWAPFFWDGELTGSGAPIQYTRAQKGAVYNDTTGKNSWVCSADDGLCDETDDVSGLDDTFGWINQDSGRPIFWNAATMAADGTECSAPGPITLVASGPRQIMIACAMGTAETDGFIHGVTQLPPSFNAAEDATFTIVANILTDSGAGTLHGYIEIQCMDSGVAASATYDAGANMDVVEIAGDVSNGQITGISSTVDTATCAPNEILFWRYKVCDTDATPSTGCTSSAGFENDFRFLYMRMN